MVKRDKPSTDEIEIDLEKPEPLNKKQKRLLKKGKVDETGKKPEDQSKIGPASGGDKKSEFGAWIGNLSFETSRDDLIRFLQSREISIDDILRVHMPLKNKRNQGFAYIDVTKQAILDKCIALSESDLNGRNLLIKNANSFTGRPPSKDSQNHKPSRILFVGNLSFDTTKDQLESHFQHCGEISRIRMATFEDSGNCKGFAFVDFQSIDAAAEALADKRCKKLNGRDLRMEYGEDRSQRRPGFKSGEARVDGGERRSDKPEKDTTVTETKRPPSKADQKSISAEPEKSSIKSKPRSKSKPSGPTSGQALVNAQRASIGIAASKGKKITFN